MRSNQNGFVQGLILLLAVVAIGWFAVTVFSNIFNAEPAENISTIGQGNSEDSEVPAFVGAGDADAKTNLNAARTKVISFQAQFGGFPTKAEFSDAAWRAIYLRGVKTTGLNKTFIYSVYPSGCDNFNILCDQYELYVDLSVDGQGVDDGNRDIKDYVLEGSI